MKYEPNPTGIIGGKKSPKPQANPTESTKERQEYLDTHRVGNKSGTGCRTVILASLVIIILLSATVLAATVEARNGYVPVCYAYRTYAKVIVYEKVSDFDRNPYRPIVTHYWYLNGARMRSGLTYYYGITFSTSRCSVY